VGEGDRRYREAVGLDPAFEPVAAVTRGGGVESVHRGAIAVVDSDGRLLGGIGDPWVPVHLRSAAKPFQALAVVESGAADAFGITQEELAVMCGSHGGEPRHIVVVEGLLGRLGLTAAALACGARPPLDAASAAALREQGVAATPLHNNCSGKHAGMLALALHLGASTEGYCSPQHPVQERILRAIRDLAARGRIGATSVRAEGFGLGPGASAGTSSAVEAAEMSASVAPAADEVRAAGPDLAAPPEVPAASAALDSAPADKRLRALDALGWAGVDGCGVPVLRMPLAQAAWLFALLAAGQTPALARLRQAMLSHPELVAGRGRLDTTLMAMAPGRILSKAGAEGVQALAFVPGFDGDPRQRAVPRGCVVKVEDGSQRALPALSLDFLASCDLAEPVGRLAALYPGSITTVDGREAGKIISLVNRGDLRRREGRSVSLDGPGEDIDFESRDIKVSVGRGDEREVVRFLREEWPAADEEVFGRTLEWNVEPFALILRGQRQVVAVLKGHFLGGVGSVDELMVRKRYRGRGVGSRLLRMFEEEAATRGCGRIVLRAVKGAPSEGFYRNRGFSREAVQFSYEFGFDYVRLTKVIDPAAPRKGVGRPRQRDGFS
jgi:L-asparaginase II/GNAT superfamily N-acetyltransferase